MKATGIVRRVDGLGRFVLPKEIRDNFGVSEGDPLEVYVEGNRIILLKYERGCVFCGEINATSGYMGKLVCQRCRERLSSRG